MRKKKRKRLFAENHTARAGTYTYAQHINAESCTTKDLQPRRSCMSKPRQGDGGGGAAGRRAAKSTIALVSLLYLVPPAVDAPPLA